MGLEWLLPFIYSYYRTTVLSCSVQGPASFCTLPECSALCDVLCRRRVSRKSITYSDESAPLMRAKDMLWTRDQVPQYRQLTVESLSADKTPMSVRTRYLDKTVSIIPLRFLAWRLGGKGTRRLDAKTSFRVLGMSRMANSTSFEQSEGKDPVDHGAISPLVGAAVLRPSKMPSQKRHQLLQKFC